MKYHYDIGELCIYNNASEKGWLKVDESAQYSASEFVFLHLRLSAVDISVAPLTLASARFALYSEK